MLYNIEVRRLVQQERKRIKDLIFITACLSFGAGVFSGYFLTRAEAAGIGMDECKSSLYSRTRFIRHQVEAVENSCHAWKLPEATCLTLSRETLQKTLASLPKLDNNLIIQCRKYQVYANN